MKLALICLIIIIGQNINAQKPIPISNPYDFKKYIIVRDTIICDSVKVCNLDTCIWLSPYTLSRLGRTYLEGNGIYIQNDTLKQSGYFIVAKDSSWGLDANGGGTVELSNNGDSIHVFRVEVNRNNDETLGESDVYVHPDSIQLQHRKNDTIVGVVLDERGLRVSSEGEFSWYPNPSRWDVNNFITKGYADTAYTSGNIDTTNLSLRLDSMINKYDVDSINYTGEIPINPASGTTWYEDGTLKVKSDIVGVTQDVGEELWSRKVRNNTGSIILNGTVVRISGNIGNKMTIAKASYSTIDSSGTMLGVATHDIAINGDGRITLIGKVGDLNTSAYIAGDTLYLSHSGLLRKTKPTTGIPIRIGFVEYSHNNQGRIIVSIHYCNDIRTTTETNGTGFLKGNGSVISFDNTTYINRADSNLFLPGYYPTMTKVRYMIDTAINAITIDTTQIATLYALNDTAKNLRTTINLKVNFRDSMKLSVGGYATYKALVDSANAIRTTLNGKQPLLTNPITGTLVSGEIPVANGVTTITSSPTFKYDITNRILGLNNGNIADVAAPAIQIKNHTPSTTVPAPIHIPGTIDFKGTARNSSSGLSENHFWRIQVLPATANPTSSAFNWYSSLDSITWTRRGGINNSGNLDITGTIATTSSITAGTTIGTSKSNNGNTVFNGFLMQNTTPSTNLAQIQRSSYARINGTWWDGTASRTHWGYFYSTGVPLTQKQRFGFGQSTDVGGIFNDMLVMEDIRNLTSTDNMLLNRGLFTRRFGFSLIGVNKSMRLQTDTLNSALIYDDAGGFVIAKASKANIDGGYPTILAKDTTLIIDSKRNNLIELKKSNTLKYRIDSIGLPHSNMPHTALYRNTDLTISATQNIWYNITGFTSKDADYITLTGDSIQITKAGHYLITWTTSFGGLNNEIWETAVFKNNVMEEPSQLRYTSTTDVGNMSTPVYISSDGDDWFTFKIRNTTDNDDPTIKRVSVVVSTIHLNL